MRSHKPSISSKPMAVVEFTRKSQSIISLEERKRQKDSVRKYNMYDGGGDDAS